MSLLGRITVGADPEVFLTNGEYIISAIGKVGGTKKIPYKVPMGALQEDNVLAEFNIAPAASENAFVEHIHTVMAQLRARVAPLDIDIRPSYIFPEDYLLSEGPQAMNFGCDPDFDCWTGKSNTMNGSAHAGLRTGAGHIHVGYRGAPPSLIAQAMDIRLGAASVLIDSDPTRRELYGKSGAYRPKPYGAEYRVPSNAWLKSESLIRWVFRTTITSVEHISSITEDLEKIGGLEILRQCINESNIGLSEHIVNALNVEMPA